MKRQKLDPESENVKLDIIIDDCFLKSLNEDHKPYFEKVLLMVDTMANLDEEDGDIAANLNGIVVEKEEEKQNVNTSIASTASFEAFFDQIMKKTLKNRVSLLTASNENAQLKTGL